MFFLDSDLFKRTRAPLRTHTLGLPLELVHCLGEAPWTYDVDVYFNSVHTYFPISKRVRNQPQFLVVGF
jgi:hypothetical protein